MEIMTIVEGCKKGSSTSQSELYKCYKKLAFNTIKKFIKDDMDAEDILQNGFVKLYKCIGQYDGKGNFEGWIYRIFRNMSIDFLRKKKYSFEFGDNIEPTIEGEKDFKEERLNDIDFVLQTLPKSYKTVMIMYYYENLQHKEIAKRLKINEGTSKSHLHRAKQKIMKELKNKVYES